jgi:hypothetical protein
MRVVSRVATIVAVALLASSCAYTDHFDNRVATYDLATEQARDQMILTNIIRASRAEPLAFQQLGTITGQTSAGATIGLPSLVLGPKAGLTAAARELDGQSVFGANPGAPGFTGNSATTSASTAFGVTPAETKDFYRGLLLTVAPETLGYFSEQGIAPETLFYLFTEKVTETKGGRVTQYVNDPIDADNFAHFQRYVALAGQYGLSAEPQPGLKLAKPKPKSSNGAESEKSEEEVPSGAEWRLCFDKSLWAQGTPSAKNRPLCGSKEKMADERTVSFVDREGIPVTLRVAPRSTFSIFQYLGRLVAEGEIGQIKLATDAARGREPLFDDRLFVVSSDSTGGGCFLAVGYEGRNYCVPADGALNTKRILGMLAQLLALSTSVRDITNVPQVQVLQ